MSMVKEKAKMGRPPMNRTETLYLRIDPALKQEIVSISESLTPEIGRVTMTDVVVYLLQCAIADLKEGKLSPRKVTL